MNHPSNAIRAGDAMPAPVGPYTTVEFSPAIPQREDYVPPVVADHNTGFVCLNVSDALTLHKFLEVNAVYPEEKELADKLRGIIEGR